MDMNKEKDIIETPILQGKLKQIFYIGKDIENQLKNELINLYNSSSFKNSITPNKIHQIVLNIFTNEYYPMISRSLKIDENNYAVIMGGIAFNMNIPKKMINFLDTETDDIDLKIYTTDITENNKQSGNVSKVLSIFRFMTLIISMYIKQISSLIVKITEELFEDELKTKKTLKNTKSKNSKSRKSISNNNIKSIINQKQKIFGVIKNSKSFIIIKSPEGNESIDISPLSYEETFKLINDKINDVDLLITNKLFYYIRYLKPYNVPHNKIKITFSDSKVIYANKDYPAFYSYYFMKNKKHMNKSLNDLYNMKLKVNQIIDTKPCRNNCKYISVESLLLDITLMLSYANLLINENISSGNVLVPIGSIYKYYKYMIKFIKLHIVKKYYNGSLSIKFINPAKKLMRYVKETIDKKTEQIPENLPINIEYKKILNTFHQDFFINKSLLHNYVELNEIVDTYNKYNNYITNSKNKFNEEEGQKGGSINIIYKNISYDDYELDNIYFTVKEQNKIIKNKILDMFKEEISNLTRLTKKI